MGNFKSEKQKQYIGHFAMRFLAGAWQSDHTCCWHRIFVVRFLAWRTAKGECLSCVFCKAHDKGLCLSCASLFGARQT
jgi:hypothetical protein